MNARRPPADIQANSCMRALTYGPARRPGRRGVPATVTCCDLSAPRGCADRTIHPCEPHGKSPLVVDNPGVSTPVRYIQWSP